MDASRAPAPVSKFPHAPEAPSARELAIRVLVAATARRRALTMAGAALDRLIAARTQSAGRGTQNERDVSLAVGCGPTPESFAAHHLVLTPAEAAAARGLARAAEVVARTDAGADADAVTVQPAEAAVAGEGAALGPPPPADSRGVGADTLGALAPFPPPAWPHLGRVIREANAATWVAAARSEPPANLVAKLRVAESGEPVSEICAERISQPEGRLPGGRFVIARTVRLNAEQHDTFWRVQKRLSSTARDVVVPSAVMVAVLDRLARAVREDGAPIGAAERPRREWFVDPLRQRAWLQTSEGRLEVPLAFVPSPGPKVRVHVCTRANPNVPHTALALLDAFPALRCPGAEAEPPVGAGAALWPPPPDSDVAADAAAAQSGADPSGTPEGRATRNEACALPDPATAPPDAVRALSASAARVSHALRYTELEALSSLEDRAEWDAEAQALVRAVHHTLGISSREAIEARRVGFALRDLPHLAAAFAAGDVSYSKVRAVAHKATAETDQGWTRLARYGDTHKVEAWAAVARRGDEAPRLREDLEPLLPQGFTVPIRFHVTLTPRQGDDYEAVARALTTTLGHRPGRAEELAAMCALWLTLESPRPREAVIYLLSPESRLARDPSAVLAPALRATGNTLERLCLAFPHLATQLRSAPPPVTGGRLCGRPRPARLPVSEPSTPLDASERRRISAHVRAVVRWLDGEVCITPGCRRTLTTQHDHHDEVHQGGRANAAVDHRLCGACNRAKHRGELRLVVMDDESVRFLDRQGRRFGTIRLGAELDAAIRAKVWAEAEAEVARASWADLETICAPQPTDLDLTDHPLALIT